MSNNRRSDRIRNHNQLPRVPPINVPRHPRRQQQPAIVNPPNVCKLPYSTQYFIPFTFKINYTIIESFIHY